MRICDRALNFVQIVDADGTVRICSWKKDGGIVGRLSENSMEEIYNSKAAKISREMHLKKDYSNCNPNACPYVANNCVDKHSIDIDVVPRLPEELYLAYENVCNYRCVSCTIPECMEKNKGNLLEEKYNKIDREIEKILPYVKRLSANGLGEFFVSKHIMGLMSKWNPIIGRENANVTIETNGSLFDKQHWQQVENLGESNLSVAITVMSFNERDYQYLSGTKLPVSRVIDNLKFVKSLGKKEL